MNNVSIISAEKCYGCGACMAKCNKNAISSTADKHGFQHFAVNNEVCINCGICLTVCPANNSGLIKESKNKYYGIINDNKEVRNQSTSGGAFSIFAEKIIKMDGVVFGAAFDDNLTVKHIGISSTEEISKLRKSKYVQSDTSNSYRAVEQILNTGRCVLYSGTPCQVEAMKHYLKKAGVNTDKLYTIDILCHGVPSPGVWSEYIEWIEEKEQSQVTDFDFRTTEYGWHQALCRVKLNNGNIIKNCNLAEGYSRLFHKNLILRESCYSCRYSSPNRVSDITLGDFWNIEKIHPEFDDNHGVSLVIVNTEKGTKLLDLVEKTDVVCTACFDEVKQQALMKPAFCSFDRSIFWNEYENKGLDFLIKKYGALTASRRIKVAFMIALNKCGILVRLRKLLNITG